MAPANHPDAASEALHRVLGLFDQAAAELEVASAHAPPLLADAIGFLTADIQHGQRLARNLVTYLRRDPAGRKAERVQARRRTYG